MDKILYIGIDISAEKFDVCSSFLDKIKCLNCSNNDLGFKKLLEWIKSFNAEAVKVVCESTGIYHLDLVMYLKSQNIPVMVVNALAAKRFKQAQMQRAKTDKVDAESLMIFCRKMDFVEWVQPSKSMIELKMIGSRVRALIKELTAEQNRWHAAISSKSTPNIVKKDIRQSVEQITKRIKKLEKLTYQIVEKDADLFKKYQLIDSIPGFARRSTLFILMEIARLPSGLTAKQLVAYAGLDPRPFESGSSIKAKTKISKHGIKVLRKILYMPAINMSTRCAEAKAFFANLVSRGKAKKQALIAIMRKLLHIIYGMLKTHTTFNPKLGFASKA